MRRRRTWDVLSLAARRRGVGRANASACGIDSTSHYAARGTAARFFSASGPCRCSYVPAIPWRAHAKSLSGMLGHLLSTGMSLRMERPRTRWFRVRGHVRAGVLIALLRRLAPGDGAVAKNGVVAIWCHCALRELDLWQSGASARCENWTYGNRREERPAVLLVPVAKSGVMAAPFLP